MSLLTTPIGAIYERGLGRRAEKETKAAAPTAKSAQVDGSGTAAALMIRVVSCRLLSVMPLLSGLPVASIIDPVRVPVACKAVRIWVALLMEDEKNVSVISLPLMEAAENPLSLIPVSNPARPKLKLLKSKSAAVPERPEFPSKTVRVT